MKLEISAVKIDIGQTFGMKQDVCPPRSCATLILAWREVPVSTSEAQTARTGSLHLRLIGDCDCPVVIEKHVAGGQESPPVSEILNALVAGAEKAE